MPKLIYTGSQIVTDTADRIKFNNADHPEYSNVEEVLNKLLYVPPVINSFNLSVGTVEIGSTVLSVLASWTVNKTMTLLTLTDAMVNVGDTSYSFDPVALTSNKTYTLTCGDGQNSVSSSRSISFSNKRYWGVSALDTLTTEDILGLSSEFSSSKSKSISYNCTGGRYFYFCYPTSFGSISNVTVGGLAFSDFTVSTQSFTNASGYTSNYNVVRCNSIQTGSNINVVWS